MDDHDEYLMSKGFNGYYQGKDCYTDRMKRGPFDMDLRRCISDIGNWMKRKNDAYLADCAFQKKQPDPKHLITREEVMNALEFIACEEMFDDDLLDILGFLTLH